MGKLIESMLPLWEGRGDKGVEIAFARPRVGTAIVSGDESRLKRLIDNLVDNAISFSPKGGVVEVRAAAVGDEVLVAIQDEGPGVPGESREEIFRRFHSVRPERGFRPPFRPRSRHRPRHRRRAWRKHRDRGSR